jgi:hypothetical protein
MIRILTNLNCRLSVVIICVVCQLLTLTPGITNANQTAGSIQSPRAAFESDGVNVVEIAGDRGITLQVAMTAKTFELTTPYGYDRVHTIRRFKNLLAVTATSYGMIKGFFIIDLSSQRFIDEVWGRDIVISPSGQYIAFIEFYPNHGPQPEDKYLIGLTQTI